MKAALYKSLALHAVVFLLFMVDLPLFWREDMVVSQPPIIVDLEQVKISEITNLPAKAKIAEETKTPARAKKMPPKPEPKPRSKPTPQPQKVEQPSVIESQPEPVPEEAPLPPKQDFVVPPQPSKPKLPDKKPEPKRPTPSKPAAKPESKKPAPKKAEKKKNAAGQRFEKPYGFRQCVGKKPERCRQRGDDPKRNGNRQYGNRRRQRRFLFQRAVDFRNRCHRRPFASVLEP